MTHPKTAWKFKAWTEAMLRNAQVGTPDYDKHHARLTGSKTSRMTSKRRRRRRKKKKHGWKTG